MADKRRQMTDDEIWDYASNQLAMAEAGLADDSEDVDELDRKARDRIRQLRRDGFEKLESFDPLPREEEMPERIRDMPLDEVADRLDEIYAEATGLVQVTPYDLDEMDEETLRVTLWELEEQLRRA